MNRKTFVTNKPPIEPTHRWEDGKSGPAMEPMPVVDGVFYALPPETTEEGVPLSYPNAPDPGPGYQSPPGTITRPLTPEEIKRVRGMDAGPPKPWSEAANTLGIIPHDPTPEHWVRKVNPTPAPTRTDIAVTTQPKETRQVVIKFSGKEAVLLLRVLEAFSLGVTGSICDSDLGPGDAQVVTMELAEPYLTRLKSLIRNYSHFATWDGKSIP